VAQAAGRLVRFRIVKGQKPASFCVHSEFCLVVTAEARDADGDYPARSSTRITCTWLQRRSVAWSALWRSADRQWPVAIGRPVAIQSSWEEDRRTLRVPSLQSPCWRPYGPCCGPSPTGCGKTLAGCPRASSHGVCTLLGRPVCAPRWRTERPVTPRPRKAKGPYFPKETGPYILVRMTMWRRRESNPRPATFPHKLLRA